MANSRLSPTLLMLRSAVSPILGKKRFQSFFELLYLFSLSGMNYGWTEPKKSGELYVINLILGKIKNSKDAVIFDVGANKGEYTANFIQLMDKNSIKLYLFEPLAEAVKFLNNRFSKNTSIKISHRALGDREDMVKIYYDGNSSELGTLYKNKLSGIDEIQKSGSQTTQVTTIDLFCVKEKIAKIHFLKIDTEGHELRVLEGAKKMMNEGKIDYIQFEFGGTMIHSRTFFSEIFALLHDKYKIYRILQDGLREITHCNETNEIFVTINFLAVKKSLS